MPTDDADWEEPELNSCFDIQLKTIALMMQKK